MAEYIGKIGLSDSLSSTPIDEGFLFTPDDGVLYLDYIDHTDSNTHKRAQIIPTKENSVKSVSVTSGVIKVTTQDGNSEYYTIPVMSGASDSAAGSSGLVPAPQVGDQDKFLKADGTWGVVEITCDAELNETSENPVQNKIITAKLNELTQKITELESLCNTTADLTAQVKSVTDKYATMLNIIGNYK